MEGAVAWPRGRRRAATDGDPVRRAVSATAWIAVGGDWTATQQKKIGRTPEIRTSGTSWAPPMRERLPGSPPHLPKIATEVTHL